MPSFIEELKTEHAAITTLLEKVKGSGITSPEAWNNMILMKSKLMAHLTKEDEKFYPALRHAGEHDEKLKTTLDFFAADMEKVTNMVSGFFKKYPNGGSGVEFAIDVGTLFGSLSGRIRVEDHVLFPEYEKLEEPKPA